MNYKKYESFMLVQQRYRINELQEKIILQEQVIDTQNTLIQRMNERIEEADEAIKGYQKMIESMINDIDEITEAVGITETASK